VKFVTKKNTHAFYYFFSSPKKNDDKDKKPFSVSHELQLWGAISQTGKGKGRVQYLYYAESEKILVTMTQLKEKQSIDRTRRAW